MMTTAYQAATWNAPATCDYSPTEKLAALKWSSSTRLIRSLADFARIVERHIEPNIAGVGWLERASAFQILLLNPDSRFRRRVSGAGRRTKLGRVRPAELQAMSMWFWDFGAVGEADIAQPGGGVWFAAGDREAGF